MKKIILSSILLSFFISGFGQDKKQSIELKGYTDTYYAVFNDDLGRNELQSFTTVSARDRQFSLNVAQLGIHYKAKNVRSNLTLHYGDIAKATWSTRFSMVQEANVGVHLFPNWWLDMGFFTTHIGTESFLPKNNYLSSTAVLTYNEPFFQAGAKLSYEGSDKYDLEFWIVNGYNFFLDTNKDKSIGLLFNYNITDKTSITYTNLTGDERRSSLLDSQIRSYHNLYLNTAIKKIALISVGFDYGIQTNTIGSDETAFMFGGLATLRLNWTEKLSTTLRQEIFVDDEGFISGEVNTTNQSSEGLKITGSTIGIEYKPSGNSYIRAETRMLNSLSEEAILFNNESQRSRWESMITMGYYFSKKW